MPRTSLSKCDLLCPVVPSRYDNLALAYLWWRRLDATTATLHEVIDVLEAGRGGHA